MACPKKKTSHRKQHQRRANWKADIPKIVNCSNCGAPSLPHIVCTSCGYYNGREYLRALPRKQRKATA